MLSSTEKELCDVSHYLQLGDQWNPLPTFHVTESMLVANKAIQKSRKNTKKRRKVSLMIQQLYASRDRAAIGCWSFNIGVGRPPSFAPSSHNKGRTVSVQKGADSSFLDPFSHLHYLSTNLNHHHHHHHLTNKHYPTCSDRLYFHRYLHTRFRNYL